ncbi:hypothetical protein [Aestuariivirga litoralis]|uniref:hypothetical protein n=1 Tax=Aestuariivirga litoralis TaxID=2650924 RepID=UPI0018C46BF2|nr:hypothetical protein [Aestuariivirga litoralis]MBG1231576.1 hypothetical protein [Aestuariivirga litoralis]
MRVLIFLISIFVIAFSSQARASGDAGCTPSLQAFHTDFSSCDNMAVISPANDTRVNFTLLLLDLRGKSADKLNDAQSSAYSNWPNSDWAWPTDWQSFAALFAAPVDDAQKPADDGSETYGEGTICISDSSGADGFVKAVTSDSGVEDTEKQALTDARKQIHCSSSSDAAATPLPTLTVHSPAATEFAAYLAAINKFYTVDHNDPAGFTSLKEAKQPWVKEAAIYMEARVKLLAALQSGLSDYGDVDLAKSDKTAAAAAGEALNAYIKAYPEGTYLNSARGLLRRAFWLSGDAKQQLEAYSAQINDTADAVKALSETDLSQEIDAKLPSDAYHDAKADPLLLATDLLKRMRPNAPEDAKLDLTEANLDAVKDVFKDKPELFVYLQAALAHFVKHDDKAVLALLPEQKITDKLNNLAFATAMLRAEAAHDAKGFADVIEHASSPLQRANAELALAMVQERAGKADAVFAKDSPVSSTLVRVHLLEYVAGPGLLRRETINAATSRSERELALYTLLYRDLTQGAYKSFVDDVKLIAPAAANVETPDLKLGPRPALKDFLWDGKGEGFDCPALAAIAAKLAASPKDGHAKLCLGEFLRLVIGDEFELATRPAKDELGGSALMFPGTTITRQDIYTQVMADVKAAGDDKAFALSRAINCYASVGDNHCGGKDVDKNVRKGWFNRLKSEFGSTAYARDTKYYY